MEIFCGHRTDRNVISPGGIVVHAMDHFASAGFYGLQLDYDCIIYCFGYYQSDGRRKQEKEKKALLLNYPLNRFLLGLSMSALNPAQIPFWFIWTGYFINQGLLKSGFAEFNLFTLGSGIGTLGGLIIYMYGGNWLVKKMNTSNRTLNKLMGIIFIIAAVAQLYRVLRP